MKTLIAIKSIFIIVLIAFILINAKANIYKEKCMEREFAKRLHQQDSTYNVMYERILKGNYKPKKVK